MKAEPISQLGWVKRNVRPTELPNKRFTERRPSDAGWQLGSLGGAAIGELNRWGLMLFSHIFTVHDALKGVRIDR
jgi:hypothetical protein